MVLPFGVGIGDVIQVVNLTKTIVSELKKVRYFEAEPKIRGTLCSYLYDQYLINGRPEMLLQNTKSWSLISKTSRESCPKSTSWNRLSTTLRNLSPSELLSRPVNSHCEAFWTKYRKLRNCSEYGISKVDHSTVSAGVYNGKWPTSLT